MSRAIDAAEHAVTCLRRLMREQDAASARSCARIVANNPDTDAADAAAKQGRAALATSRGEAAAAAEALVPALAADPWTQGLARAQFAVLRSIDSIPSATLGKWADGWEAYAARETAPSCIGTPHCHGQTPSEHVPACPCYVAPTMGGSTEDGTELCSYCRGMPHPGATCPTCARRGKPVET